ncbi:tetracycline resistance MFS efflux pump [Thalassobium sp. R2A62]|uniref:TCR/Tet family MFS transporter n=1 Tax=Thalassobium sp. R2A62 TaxID=633131 RepID=UPI0001B1D20E|nr:tetracycline resistance MFS efflux pump [Thalassobium sp. R2A62]EET46257.1 tetracycline resistance protein, class A [Thalassobium sp. R2A62]MDG2452538.1 tetracycline resistance MFS efflux pump [Paracoccaceae bacterium]
MDQKTRRRAFLFILITLFLDAMGIALIIPVMPDLIQSVNGGTLGNAAIWGGIFTTSFAVMQFLFGPTIGALSDRFGRRPVLLLSLAVMALNYAVLSTAQTIWLLLIIQFVNGIASATQATATAFIADISKPEEKSQNFGLVGAAFGVGFVLGPVIGGLLGDVSPRAPFIAAGLLATANLILGTLILPETVTDAIRRPFEARRANPFGAFKAISKLPDLTRLLTIVVLYEFAFIAYPAIWAYFTRARFDWDAGLVGLSLGAFGIAMAIMQGFVIRWIIPKMGEAGALVFAFSFNLMVFTMLAFLTNGTLALILTPLSAVGAIVTPTLQGMMSKRVPDNQQGELQGLIASARSIALIFSPLVMTQVFWLFTSPGMPFLPGAPFLLSATIMVACLLVFTGRRRHTAT